MADALTLNDRLAQAERSAVHLEMRDGYMRSSKNFIAWQQGVRLDPADRDAWWSPWLQLTSDLAARGVQLRRARVVSQPVSDYVQFEYDVSFRNIAAGEDIRWLDRRHASDLALPGNDFWLIDDRLIVFHIFDGEGEIPDGEDEQIVTDPAVIRLCADSFEAVWARAVPHDKFQPI